MNFTLAIIKGSAIQYKFPGNNLSIVCNRGLIERDQIIMNLSVVDKFRHTGINIINERFS